MNNSNPLYIIEIRQTIGTDYRCYSSQKFKEDLELVPAERKIVYIDIDSSGGSLFETYEILGAMELRKEQTECSFFGRVTSMACSAATLILLSCDHRRITKEGVVMIHCPSANCYGNSDDFRMMHELLVESEDEMIEFYQKKLPRVKPETVKQWVKGKADNYFNADECLAMGIAHQIVSGSSTKPSTAAAAVANARERFNRDQKEYAAMVARQVQAKKQSERFKQGLEHSLFPERFAVQLIAKGLRSRNKMLTNIGKRYFERARKNR